MKETYQSALRDSTGALESSSRKGKKGGGGRAPRVSLGRNHREGTVVCFKGKGNGSSVELFVEQARQPAQAGRRGNAGIHLLCSNGPTVFALRRAAGNTIQHGDPSFWCLGMKNTSLHSKCSFP